MTLIGRFWHALATWLTMSPLGSPPAQHPLGVPITHSPDVDVEALPGAPGRFHPPAGNPKNPGFTCDYSAMKGWYPCSTPEDRGCWLRHRDGREFNLHTNYENFAPVGITRHYTLNITDTSFNADGQPFDEAKLFNNQYPGPWLEACWGDVSIISAMLIRTNTNRPSTLLSSIACSHQRRAPASIGTVFDRTAPLAWTVSTASLNVPSHPATPSPTASRLCNTEPLGITVTTRCNTQMACKAHWCVGLSMGLRS